MTIVKKSEYLEQTGIREFKKTQNTIKLNHYSLSSRCENKQNDRKFDKMTKQIVYYNLEINVIVDLRISSANSAHEWPLR